jgi:sarcosine oxidase/L-pipecolate oxidase
LFDADGTTCKGIETVDGTQYFADKVVLAAGAWSPTLVDLEDQCVSKVSSSANIKTQMLISRHGSMPICSFPKRKLKNSRILQ